MLNKVNSVDVKMYPWKWIIGSIEYTVNLTPCVRHLTMMRSDRRNLFCFVVRINWRLVNWRKNEIKGGWSISQRRILIENQFYHETQYVISFRSCSFRIIRRRAWYVKSPIINSEHFYFPKCSRVEKVGKHRE